MNRAGLIGITLVLALLAPTGHAVRATGSTGTIVFEWNQILQDSFPTQGVGTLRPFAMTHIAMFDAVNAIEREFEPYRVRLRGGGSPDAAAAQAAHDVLVGLNPSAAATYDAALARQLGSHPSGFVRRGAAVGAAVAKEILAWRQSDGWAVPVPAPPPYNPPDFPGLWRPTPGITAATFIHLQNAMPLALPTSTYFLPPPPPMIDSPRYAADLNEVMDVGAKNSTTRTPEQTTIARLWAGVAPTGPPGTATNFLSMLNNVVRSVAEERRLSLVDTARLFTLVNVSIHDALQTTQTSKFVYGMWRPVTAIRLADTDLNPATEPNPDWEPLIGTPPYPSYAGNIVTIGTSAARALQLAFKTNDIPVTARWRLSGGGEASHHFSGFWEIAEQAFMVRIHSGIHYRFDQEAGQAIGRSVAEYVFANFMNPRSRWSD